MVIRIERVLDGQFMILRLSGRLRSEHVEQLKSQIEGNAQTVTLDLHEVKLVDREVVHFLGLCEANGVRLIECSPYIRDWIDRVRASEGDS